MSDWNEQDVETAMSEVMRRASTDPEYRELALRDPIAAVRAVSTLQIPPDFKLQFVDNAGANMTLVLPDPIDVGELSEEELEQIAGGRRGDTVHMRDRRDYRGPLSGAPKRFM